MVTPSGIKEYVEAVRERYGTAAKDEKGKILDEFTKNTGRHRKSVIRMLNRVANKGGRIKRQGRPLKYEAKVIEALRLLWEASDRLCSKRLRPFIPELVRLMRTCGEIQISTEIEAELCRMSAATIDRRLQPWKRKGGRHSLSTTSPGKPLRNAIPIRTFGDWKEGRPGFIEVDLVAHCGESGDGFYLNTLMAVDVATGWSEFAGVWGKGQQRVGTAVHQVRERLPFPLLGLDSDNGTEFMNQGLANWCRREGITFTRSRPYKKNDNCFVEQKNGSIVRRIIGHDRYSSKEALEALNRTYYLLRWYINFLQPVMKLVKKTRQGARVYKIYDTAQTPYQRALDSGVLTEAKKAELSTTYARLNPALLLKQINDNVQYLWKLRDRHGEAREP
jgi:transposase